MASKRKLEDASSSEQDEKKVKQLLSYSPHFGGGASSASNSSWAPQQSYHCTGSGYNQNDFPPEQDFDARKIVNEFVEVYERLAVSCSNNVKPHYSYTELVFMAVMRSPNFCLPIHEIYRYIENRFPYFQETPREHWKNAVRHSLSKTRCFTKIGVDKQNDRAGILNRSSYLWTMIPKSVISFARGDYRPSSDRQSGTNTLRWAFNQVEALPLWERVARVVQGRIEALRYTLNNCPSPIRIFELQICVIPSTPISQPIALPEARTAAASEYSNQQRMELREQQHTPPVLTCASTARATSHMLCHLPQTSCASSEYALSTAEPACARTPVSSYVANSLPRRYENSHDRDCHVQSHSFDWTTNLSDSLNNFVSYATPEGTVYFRPGSPNALLLPQSRSTEYQCTTSTPISAGAPTGIPCASLSNSQSEDSGLGSESRNFSSYDSSLNGSYRANCADVDHSIIASSNSTNDSGHVSTLDHPEEQAASEMLHHLQYDHHNDNSISTENDDQSLYVNIPEVRMEQLELCPVSPELPPLQLNFEDNSSPPYLQTINIYQPYHCSTPTGQMNEFVYSDCMFQYSHSNGQCSNAVNHVQMVRFDENNS